MIWLDRDGVIVHQTKADNFAVGAGSKTHKGLCCPVPFVTFIKWAIICCRPHITSEKASPNNGSSVMTEHTHYRYFICLHQEPSLPV